MYCMKEEKDFERFGKTVDDFRRVSRLNGEKSLFDMPEFVMDPLTATAMEHHTFRWIMAVAPSPSSEYGHAIVPILQHPSCAAP